MNNRIIKYVPIKRDYIDYRIKWLNDSEVNQYLGTEVRKGTDKKFHNEWFDDYEEDEKMGKQKIFMIEVDSKLIGQIGLLDINQSDKNAVLYVVIGEKEYWGQGIAKEAIKFIHDFAFQKLGLHKINLYVHTGNIRAIALYKKTGYKHIGISHENIYKDGKFEDEMIMEIIK